MNTLGQKIRQLRKERGLTQTQLAEILSTSQDTVSLWEVGKSLPDANNIIALCRYFEVSADYLLGLEDF